MRRVALLPEDHDIAIDRIASSRRIPAGAGSFDEAMRDRRPGPQCFDFVVVVAQVGPGGGCREILVDHFLSLHLGVEKRGLEG
jgi:hypothetical protein